MVSRDDKVLTGKDGAGEKAFISGADIKAFRDGADGLRHTMR